MLYKQSPDLDRRRVITRFGKFISSTRMLEIVLFVYVGGWEIICASTHFLSVGWECTYTSYYKLVEVYIPALSFAEENIFSDYSYVEVEARDSLVGIDAFGFALYIVNFAIRNLLLPSQY